MKWTLQLMSATSLAFQIISEEGLIIHFKYSIGQHTIRMRCNDSHGVFVLDEGSFFAGKFAIRNVYGSEIGSLVKGTRIENTGTLKLDSSPKLYYVVNDKESRIDITTQFSGMNYIYFDNGLSEENALLALIVFSWMHSIPVAAEAAHV